MKDTLTPSERLIVAADFKPSQDDVWIEPGSYPGENIMCSSKVEWVHRQVLKLANKLRGTGVYLKVNSALRACGYSLITEINSLGLRVFADLKLNDIPNTLTDDGILLRQTKPGLVTVMCTAGVPAMKALKAELPNTEVLGVTVLTTFTEDASKAMFTCTTEEAVMRLAHFASDASIDGLISSPKEAEVLSAKFGLALSLNTPAIRPIWAIVPGDDQNPDRIMTPAKAIKAGADRIVVGRPITGDKNPYDAVMRTIEEIANAVS